MTDEIQKALSSIPLLAPLSADALQQIAGFAMLRSVRAGETIFCQGEPSPYCFGVLSGEVAIQRVPKEKRLAPKVLSVLGPGALFGESALFEDSPRAAMASAKKDGRLVAILGSKMRDWIQREPGGGVQLLMGLLKSSMSRLQQTSGDLSVIYGLGRIFGGDKPLHEQLGAALTFLQNTVASADTVALYLRSRYWDEFEPFSTMGSAYSALPLKHALVTGVLARTAPYVLEGNVLSGALAALPAPWPSAAAVAIVPMMDRDEGFSHQGFLMIANHDNPNAFSPHQLLLLSAVAQQISDGVGRWSRQEDASAKARLKASSQSFRM